jgi:hypothetical protein
LLENRKTAVAFIGSGNLTEGGLFSNFELGTELVFDLCISGDADARASLRMELDRYLRPSKISRLLAPKLLERLVEDGAVVSERVATERLAKATRPRGTSRETSMFGTLRIPEPPRPQSISIATKGIDGAGVPRKTVKANRHSKAHRNVMKQELKKKGDRRPNAEFMRPVQPDAMLARVVGSSPLSRMELTKKVWAYIKRNVLQDKKNRRLINADDNFKRIFGGRAQVDMFQMTALVAKHVK